MVLDAIIEEGGWYVYENSARGPGRCTQQHNNRSINQQSSSINQSKKRKSEPNSHFALTKVGSHEQAGPIPPAAFRRPLAFFYYLFARSLLVFGPDRKCSAVVVREQVTFWAWGHSEPSLLDGCCLLAFFMSSDWMVLLLLKQQEQYNLRCWVRARRIIFPLSR